MLLRCILVLFLGGFMKNFFKVSPKEFQVPLSMGSFMNILLNVMGFKVNMLLDLIPLTFQSPVDANYLNRKGGYVVMLCTF